MELSIFTNPQQGATYGDILTAAQAADELGFNGFFVSDHYVAVGGVPGQPGPTDAWLTLAALARETEHVRLGTLMTSATFRLPGPLAVAVAQVDRMSGGRVEFGLGTGWFEPDHTAYGIPYPGQGERFDRFEEQLAIISGLWATPLGERFSYKGKHYELTDSPALPKPLQKPGPPIIVGGSGPKRTPRLAAQYAAEINFLYPSPAEAPAWHARVDAACAAIGRDPSSLRRSATLLLVLGRDQAEIARRSDTGGVDNDVDAAGTDVSAMFERGLIGSPVQIADRIGQLADAGFTRLYVTTPRQFDVDHFADFMQLVAPQLR